MGTHSFPRPGLAETGKFAHGVVPRAVVPRSGYPAGRIETRRRAGIAPTHESAGEGRRRGALALVGGHCQSSEHLCLLSESQAICTTVDRAGNAAHRAGGRAAGGQARRPQAAYSRCMAFRLTYLAIASPTASLMPTVLG